MIARALLVFCAAAAGLAAVSAYQSEIARWHAGREASLKAPDGWLSLAGLFWLSEGANLFGTDGANQIVLPDGPAHAGSFDLDGGHVAITMNGSTRPLAPDSADVVTVGRLNLFVIQRGDRFGIRVKDPESPARREFHGIDSYPADEAWRVTARFVAEPRKIPILNVLGQTDPSDSPGYAVFRLAGQELRLYPILEEPGAKISFLSFATRPAAKKPIRRAAFFIAICPMRAR